MYEQPAVNLPLVGLRALRRKRNIAVAAGVSTVVFRRNLMFQNASWAFRHSGHVFLASAKLSGLTFTLTGKVATQAMRMAVGERGQFYEIRLAAQPAAGSTVVIANTGSLGQGVAVQSRDATELRAVVTHGLVSANNYVTLQTTGELPVETKPVKFSLAGDMTLQLESSTPPGSIPIHIQTIDKNATVKVGPVRVVTG